MLTTSTPQTTVPHIYDGAPIYARGLTAALAFSSSWRPPLADPSQTPWSEDEHVPNCWRHRDFPGHIVWAPAPGQLFFAHTSMTSSAPKRSTVIALAHAALGPGALPTDEVMLPLSLRVPLKGPERLPTPTDPTRCLRMRPALDEPPYLKMSMGCRSSSMLLELSGRPA